MLIHAIACCFFYFYAVSAGRIRKYTERGAIMSITKFKKECVRNGLNPVVATKLHQLRLQGLTDTAEQFAPKWDKFIKEHPNWNLVVQLAGRLGVTI